MLKETIYRITEKENTAIEAVLKKGDRVELIPTKDGIIINRLKREKVIVSHETK